MAYPKLPMVHTARPRAPHHIIPYTGTSTRTASATTAYGKQTVGQAYNPYTGTYGATHQGIQSDRAMGIVLRFTGEQVRQYPAL